MFTREGTHVYLWLTHVVCGRNQKKTVKQLFSNKKFKKKKLSLSTEKMQKSAKNRAYLES